MARALWLQQKLEKFLLSSYKFGTNVFHLQFGCFSHCFETRVVVTYDSDYFVFICSAFIRILELRGPSFGPQLAS